jgi:hypothetical protein
MVEQSLFEYLKESVGNIEGSVSIPADGSKIGSKEAPTILEDELKKLISYSDEPVNLSDEVKEKIFQR